MTERIDHAAEAREFLNDVPQLTALDEYAKADMAVKAAQVHAQLALVEQQRVANCLKLAELDLAAEAAETRWGGTKLSFRIRPYLSAEDWESIEVREDGD